MNTTTRRICVIGLGQFGRELAVSFAQHAEVLAIDVDQTLVNQIADRVQRAFRLDARDYAGLASIVNRDFDEAIVSVGTNIESSVLAVLHLKKIGVPRVHAKAKNSDHARILEAVGADNIIFPERETARRLVRQVLNPNLLDFVPISDEYSVMQIAPPKEFWGRTLKDLELRRRLGIFVIAIKQLVPERTDFLPGPDFIIRDDTVLIVIGKPDALQSISDLPVTPASPDVPSSEKAESQTGVKLMDGRSDNILPDQAVQTSGQGKHSSSSGARHGRRNKKKRR